MENRAIASEDNLVPGPWHLRADLGAEETLVCLHNLATSRIKKIWETSQRTYQVSFITSYKGESYGAKGELPRGF